MSQNLTPPDDRKPVLAPTQGSAVPTTSGDAAAKAFDPWILWVTVRRCWPWAVPLGAAFAGIAAFVVMQGFTPRFQASYLLEANEDFVVFKGVMPVVENLAKSEKNLFTNPIVLDPVLEDPTLRHAPSLSNPLTADTNLRKNLSISSGGTDSRLIVSYTDTDPQAAMEVCNAIVDSYLRQRDSFDNTRVNNLERWLNPEIERWEDEVDERQKRVQSLSQKTLGYAPGRAVDRNDNDSKISRMSDLRAQVGELKIELALFDAIAAAPATLDAVVPTISTSPSLAVTEIQKKVISERDIENAIDNDPKVRAARAVEDRYAAVVLDIEVQDMVRISRDYYNDMKKNLADAKDTVQKDARSPASVSKRNFSAVRKMITNRERKSPNEHWRGNKSRFRNNRLSASRN